MDFGEILDEWERIKRARTEIQQPARKKPLSVLEAWLDANGVGDKDAEELEGEDRAEETRRRSAMKPQATLDLHGMKAEEAESAISVFIESSSRAGLEKVLVIHGKGLHSEGAPVLKKAARRALEAHPLAGRFGEANKADGGSGALWVLIRKRRAEG
jgi:DNA-nicking Smr family endonuclease